MSEESLGIVRVARIGKPHGIRGEVTVEIFTDSPESRFAPGSDLTVHPVSDAVGWEKLTVEKSRWNKKILLLKFVQCSDRDSAESLRNAELYASAADSLGSDEWYADDLIGCTVHEKSLGAASIGRVIDLITGEVQDLLEVRLLDGREVLIPLVKEIVPMVDEEKGAIIITPPPGLLELN